MSEPKTKHIWIVYNADKSVRLGQFVYATEDETKALQVAQSMGVYKEEISVVYGGVSNRKCCGQ